MSMKSSYRRMKPVEVVITMANGQVFEGRVNIGYEDRLSDFLATSERQFIPVFDTSGTKDVFLVNKEQISSVQPRGDHPEEGGGQDG